MKGVLNMGKYNIHKIRYQAVSFNIDDRDSYYMQVLILIIGIAFAFVIGLIERGCSSL